MTPYRLMRPTVGLIPASMFWFDGLRMDPDVSVPTLAAQKLAAVPMPELEPPVASATRPSLLPSRGSRRASYGLKPYPARALKFAGIGVGGPATQLASSVSIVLAMMMAPPARRLRVTVAS